MPGTIISTIIESGPQYLVNGIIVGSILSLGAVGLTTVYKILGFPNFAHGDFLAFGAYMALMFNVFFDVPLILSLINVFFCDFYLNGIVYENSF